MEADDFTFNSSTQIIAWVGSGSTGRITVTTSFGTAESSDYFTVIPAPTITSFSPASGTSGTQVTINGTNFTEDTSVQFSGTEAASVVVNSGSKIVAIVGGGSTGKITVTTPGGTAESSTDFTHSDPPAVISFTPASGGTGIEVTITGTNLAGATKVQFGGTEAADFDINSGSEIVAIVGDGSTGVVTVTTPGGTAVSSSEFTHNSLPSITSFTPASGGTGSEITIRGTNFIGVTEVRFGDVNTPFNFVSSTEITAFIGAGATGVVRVTTPTGTAESSTDFTFIPAPTITSFSPDSGPSGTLVTITGTNFTGATSVKFGGTEAGSFVVNSAAGAQPGGTEAASFVVVSGTEIIAKVGSGSTGRITVTTPGGTAESSTDFLKISSITLTDEDLPEPPSSNLTLHIIEPSPENKKGTAEIQATYQGFSWSVYLGVENNQLWLGHLPYRDKLPASLQNFYDTLGITENTTYDDDKYWFTGLPSWVNIEERDPELTGMPVVCSISSVDGELTFTYFDN